MGLDGGTKISRSDVLRGASWALATQDASRSSRGGAVSTSQVYQPPQLDAQTERAVSWTTCSISEQPLHDPVVADALGGLFNKDAVVEYLLCRKGLATDEASMHRFANQLRTFGAAFEHIRSLKDVFEIRATCNPDAAAGAGPSSSATAAAAAAAAPYMCPITLLPCGGKHPFAALRPCGHVFAERALAATGGADAACPTCSTPYDPQHDAITLNGSAERREQLRELLRARQAAGGGKRDKGSKRKREAGAAAGASGSAAGPSGDADGALAGKSKPPVQ